MLTDMIVTPRVVVAGLVSTWSVVRGSRGFSVVLGSRGDWHTHDVLDPGPVLNVSEDLSGSLEYIESLFN